MKHLKTYENMWDDSILYKVFPDDIVFYKDRLYRIIYFHNSGLRAKLEDFLDKNITIPDALKLELKLAKPEEIKDYLIQNDANKYNI